MEKKSQISAYEKEFPGWKIGKFLGRGSGAVSYTHLRAHET